MKFEDQKAMFLAVSGILNLEAIYRQNYPRCRNFDMCKDSKENTQHIFECNAYENLHRELNDKRSLQ